MKELHQPHDRFFRSMFGRRELARNLIESALPEPVLRSLDLDSLEVSGESFVDQELAAHQSDILVRTRLRGSPLVLYILVEHKSTPYRWTLLQLLRYMVRIWERERSRNRRARALAPIIPLIFYHGTRKWRVPLSFSEYFPANPDLAAFIPEFTPALFDLHGLDARRLRGGLLFQAAVRVLKYALAGLRPHLGEILRNLTALPMDEEHHAILGAFWE